MMILILNENYATYGLWVVVLWQVVFYYVHEIIYFAVKAIQHVLVERVYVIKELAIYIRKCLLFANWACGIVQAIAIASVNLQQQIIVIDDCETTTSLL